MSGKIKHMERSRYSYHNGKAGIYRNFENKAYAKRVKNAKGMSFMEKMINAMQKIKLPGFANRKVNVVEADE